jgi:hypothetical protein
MEKAVRPHRIPSTLEPLLGRTSWPRWWERWSNQESKLTGGRKQAKKVGRVMAAMYSLYLFPQTRVLHTLFVPSQHFF